MGFPGATGAKGNDVFSPLDPVAPGQFQHHHFVQGRDSLEVKAVQALHCREFGRPDPRVPDLCLMIADGEQLPPQREEP